jgi:dihydrolipoamide dehydrogenase
LNEIVTDVLVLGGGPGGYVAAIRCGQLGLKTVLVEGGRLGGTCLNVGCIPSKALIEAAHLAAVGGRGETPFGLTLSGTLDFAKTQQWIAGIVHRLNQGVAGLLRKSKVQVLNGYGRLVDGKTVDVDNTATGPVRVSARHLVLATGSKPVELANLPFEGRVISSNDAFALDTVPRSLVVVGAGYIGVELGTAFANLGSRVTLVEIAETILPGWDQKLTDPVSRRLEGHGVVLRLGTKLDGLTVDGAVVLDKEGRRDTIPAEKILVAVGRTPNVDGYGLDQLAVGRNGRFVAVNERCETSMRGVWAVGDLTGEPMLAHRAMAQGRVVAEAIAGKKVAFDPAAIPAVCFSDPEIVSVGLSPEQAGVDQGKAVAASFPLLGNGRAMTLGAEGGMVRIVADARDGIVLGVQATGPHVSELASAFALALEMGSTLDDVALTIHAHPTVSEAFGEAAFAALGHPLHA